MGHRKVSPLEYFPKGWRISLNLFKNDTEL